MAKVLVLCCLLGLATASVQIERTVSGVPSDVTGSLVLDHGCASTDQFGSNQCSLNWGDNATANIAYHLPGTLTEKSILHLDVKVLGVPLTATCQICGKACEFKIPVIGIPVQIDMPSCPITSNATIAPFSLPNASPVPLKIKFSGTLTLKDDTGALIATVTTDGEVSP
jgi:hypothetical protein